MKQAPKGTINKGIVRVKTFFGNGHKRRILLVDLYLFSLFVVGFACNWLEYSIGIFVAMGVLLLDFLSSIIQVKSEQTSEQEISVDFDSVFSQANKRNGELQERYQSVLMREKDLKNTSLMDISQHRISGNDIEQSQQSLFDTKNSNDGNLYNNS